MIPKIILLMMVKNEEHCVERAIRSALPHIDGWVVSDTGSTDRTKELVEAALGHLPGALFEDSWVGFGTNRTALYDKADRWAREFLLGPVVFLLLDADDTVLAFPGKVQVLADAGVDAWQAIKKSGPLAYPQIQLLRADLPWSWRGVTHEALQLGCGDAKVADLPGFEIGLGDDSSRRKTGRKTIEDIELLEASLDKNPDDPRAVFYLAGSYRDSGEFGKAVDLYQLRTRMGGFDEERFMSALWSGDCLLTLGDPDGATLSWLAAIQMRPWRAEPFLKLSQMHRQAGAHGLAHLWSHRIQSLPTEHKDRLFCDPTARGWRGLEEYIYGTALVGDWAENERAVQAFYSTGPAEELERVLSNCNKITAR
jgi:hypothetical protein